MAIDVLQPAGSGFINNLTSGDAQGTVTIVAAVAGKSHFVRSMTITCISAVTLTIGSTTGVLVGPVPFAATSSPFVVTFIDPVKVPAGELIDLTASGAGVVNVVIQGYTE
jgi:hypothetical protein